jgi:hypothetical protein
MIAIKREIEHFGLSRAILFFRKQKVIRSCAHLMLVTQSGSGNKSHRLDFLGDICCVPSHKQFKITTYKLGIRYLCTVPQTPKKLKMFLELR